MEQAAKIPADPSVPIGIVVGKPNRRYSVTGFTLNVFGAAPSSPTFDRLQRLLASTLGQWRRDVLPPRERSSDHLNYVWFGASPNAEPGIFASANSDAILMQYVPDPKISGPDAKLAAGILATGSHEAFHALGAVHGAPTWANESLASYFAYMAARRHLAGGSLQLLSKMIDAPSDTPLLTVQHQVDSGNQSEYGTFYSKGARFWAAIDRVLTIEPNGSGRLAALIKRTGGLSDVKWSRADRIADFLDGHSNGRAGPIVRCFLLENRCELANEPVAAVR